MSDLSEATILAALARLSDPGGAGRDPVAAGRVQGVSIAADGGRGTRVTVVLGGDPAEGAALEDLRQAAERAVAALPGVTTALAVLTATRRPGAVPAAAPPARPPAPQRPPAPAGLPHLSVPVATIIAVASGKGGVGKSTVAINLAAALAAEGHRVGVLDGDIYGPSVPRLTGLVDARPAPPSAGAGGAPRMVPLSAHGLSLMSIGFLVPEATAAIWRGPMLQKALVQMVRDVAWEGTDILVIDLPPGTGDIQLSLTQQVDLTGAVVVSTPQDLALIDARKAIDMFGRMEVPVLGIIENMSTFCCPACGTETPIFGHGGAEAEATRLGVPFLGRLPLAMEVRVSADAGVPLVVGDPDSSVTASYRAIARAVLAAARRRSTATARG